MRFVLASSILFLAAAALAVEPVAIQPCSTDLAAATAPGVVPPRLVAPFGPSPSAIPGDHTLVIDAVIDERGSISQICSVTGDPRLVRSVTAAVRQWRFEPAKTADGKPLAVRYHLTTRIR